jgi:hypothetical protein
MTDLEVPQLTITESHLTLLRADRLQEVSLAETNEVSELITELYLPRKEVIHPHLPVRIPCYDFIPVTTPTLGPSKVGTSGVGDFRDVTGGVYKNRERIQRGVLTHVY